MKNTQVGSNVDDLMFAHSTQKYTCCYRYIFIRF